MNTLRIIPLIMLVLTAPLLAEEQTVRIIGLSDASRVNDLREAIKTLPELELVSVDADKAAATLRYDPVALLGKPKPKPEELAPEKIIERIDNRIGTASIRTFFATAPTGVSEDKLTKVEIKVGVLDCKGCRYGAYIAIAKMDGVERAIVKADSRTLIAWIDSSKTNKEALEAALKKARVELPAL
jgi:copper chaperone CopZ